MSALGRAGGAAPVGTGIVSIALSLAGYELLSRGLLVLAGALLCAVAGARVWAWVAAAAWALAAAFTVRAVA